MNVQKLCFAMIGLLLCSSVWADDSQLPNTAKQWLERMIQATQTLNYEGTFVYLQGQNLETMHILHRSDSEGKRQRMVSLNGAVREILVSHNQVVCLLPQQKVAFNGGNYNRSPFPFSLPRDLDKLKAHYRFEMLGEDRIAGLQAQVIAIQPQDALRFGYRLWLDQASSMVLRSALLNEKGDIVEQLMFTNLQIKPEIDDAQLAATHSLNVAAPLKTHPSAETAEQSHWTVKEPPPGFVQIMHTRYTQNSDEYPTEHIVFSDGLATVSVFLEKLDGQPLLQGASQMGTMNAFGVLIEDHQGIVVGEVPEATVAMIANSLQYHEEAVGQ